MLTTLDRYLYYYWPELRWVKKDDSIVINLGRGEAVIYCTTTGSRVYYHIDIFWKGGYLSGNSRVVDSFDGIDKVLCDFKDPDYSHCSGSTQEYIS